MWGVGCWVLGVGCWRLGVVGALLKGKADPNAQVNIRNPNTVPRYPNSGSKGKRGIRPEF